MPALSRKRLALAGFAVTAAAAAAVAGIAFASDGDGLAVVAPAPAAKEPSFSKLANTNGGDVPTIVRQALAAAGAPTNAPTTVADRGGYLVAIARGENTYLALVNKDTGRATLVQTPADELAQQGGTWVSAGGSVDGRRTTLALLVADEVNSVDTADRRGVKSRTPVDGNIIVVQGEDLEAAEYEYGGTTRRIELTPRSSR